MNGDVPKFSLVKFRTLIRDTRGPTDPVNEVLHTQEELDAYIESTQDKQKPRHAVAFPEEKAVAVALGSRPHGGYNCEIIAVVQETGGFVGVQHHVLWVEQVPHGLATDMITFPHHVIRARGLSGVVSFRQVPDWLGHSLHALAGAITGRAPTTLATGEEAGGEPTTLATGEEAGVATTRVVGEEHLPTGFVGEHPTTFMVGEEGPTAHPTTFMVGEEGPTTLFGEHPTTFMVGEEGQTVHPTTLMVGEEGQTAQPTTLMVGEEGQTMQPTTLMVGEEGQTGQPTTFMVGEEGQGPGQGGGHGPFG
jgi:hypothetical protein